MQTSIGWNHTPKSHAVRMPVQRCTRRTLRLSGSKTKNENSSWRSFMFGSIKSPARAESEALELGACNIVFSSVYTSNRAARKSERHVARARRGLLGCVCPTRKKTL